MIEIIKIILMFMVVISPLIVGFYLFHIREKSYNKKYFTYHDIINNKPPSNNLLANHLIEVKGLIVKPDPSHMSKVLVCDENEKYLFKGFGSLIADKIVDYFKESPSNYIVKNGKVVRK